MADRRRRFGHRRSRDEELFELAAVDPAAHQRLVELRRTQPQAFRKELARLVRAKEIPAGRRGSAPAEMLAWTRLPVAGALEALEAALANEELTTRVAAAILEEEQRHRARPALVAWLQACVERLAAGDNRSL